MRTLSDSDQAQTHGSPEYLFIAGQLLAHVRQKEPEAAMR